MCIRDRGKIGSPEVEVLLKWNKVAERVRQLIRTDDYLSPEEMEKYEERQEACLLYTSISKRQMVSAKIISKQMKRWELLLQIPMALHRWEISRLENTM